MATTLEKAEREICRLVESGGQRVFNLHQLQQLYSTQRWRWQIAAKYGFQDFLDFMIDRNHLAAVDLTSESYPGFRRFTWRGASPFEVALSLRRGAFLSHGSAVFLHGLTEQLPKIVYSNKEQSPKPSGSHPTQEKIDAAFSRSQRQAKYLLEGGGMRILLLNGKATGQLEVGPLEGPSGEILEVTKLERTLIDIVVRPAYAGGVFQVLEAYRGAQDRLSVGLLLSTLDRLDYVYPYHQAIGFLMERAGFGERLLARVESLGLPFDFYLSHGMKKTVYVPRWRLFVPEGM